MVHGWNERNINRNGMKVPSRREIRCLCIALRAREYPEHSKTGVWHAKRGVKLETISAISLFLQPDRDQSCHASGSLNPFPKATRLMFAFWGSCATNAIAAASATAAVDLAATNFAALMISSTNSPVFQRSFHGLMMACSHSYRLIMKLEFQLSLCMWVQEHHDFHAVFVQLAEWHKWIQMVHLSRCGMMWHPLHAPLPQPLQHETISRKIWPASKMTKEMGSDLCPFSTIINSPHKCNSSFWCQTTPAVFAGWFIRTKSRWLTTISALRFEDEDAVSTPSPFFQVGLARSWGGTLTQEIDRHRALFVLWNTRDSYQNYSKLTHDLAHRNRTNFGLLSVVVMMVVNMIVPPYCSCTNLQ